MRVLLIVLTGYLLLSACSETTTSATVPSPTPAASITPTAEQLSSPSLQPSPTPSTTPTHAPTATATSSATPTLQLTPASSITPIPPPTLPPVGDRTPVRLVIPEISLNRELIPVGLDAQNIPIVPDHDVGWYIYSAKPGQGENIVLWGHVLRFRKAPQIPAPFANIDRLQIGSEILLYSADGTAFRYVVARKERVTPDQVQYILPTGDERLTLVSCIGDRVIVDGNVELTHRLITIAVPAP